MYHRNALKLHGSDFDIAIDQAQELIEKKVGHKVTAFVFPHDSYTDEAVSRALRLNKVIRTPEFLRAVYPRTVGIVYGGPRFSLATASRLVDIGLERQLWLMAQCHGVTEKRTMRSFKSITPEFLDAHLGYIHSKADEIWVDTFSNVFGYLSLRAHTTVETKNSKADAIDFDLHLDKEYNNRLVPLTVVIKTGAGVSKISATAQDGHALKAWLCAIDQVCIDVDAYNKNIHLQWARTQ
jgi:hypothetical protein